MFPADRSFACPPNFFFSFFFCFPFVLLFPQLDPVALSNRRLSAVCAPGVPFDLLASPYDENLVLLHPTNPCKSEWLQYKSAARSGDYQYFLFRQKKLVVVVVSRLPLSSFGQSGEITSRRDGNHEVPLCPLIAEDILCRNEIRRPRDCEIVIRRILLQNCGVLAVH